MLGANPLSLLLGRWNDVGSLFLSHRMHLLISFRKSTSPQNRQLCLLLLIKILSRRVCGGGDFLKLITTYIMRDKFAQLAEDSTLGIQRRNILLSNPSVTRRHTRLAHLLLLLDSPDRS